MKKATKITLAVALILCLISGIFASAVQSSFGAVDVEDIRIVFNEGEYVNGQIYIPEKASEENKLPLVVLSHGSYNNFDHQDMNMIELARRGFVVISSDAFCHGNSYVPPGDMPYTNMIYLVDYACANLNFIDTEKIGVSGHSMGGMIASNTVQHYFV